MRIDHTLNAHAVQQSEQSSGGPSRSAGRDEAFALLLENEIAQPKEQIAPDTPLSLPGAVSGLAGIQSPDIQDSTGSSPLSQAVSALDDVLTQFDSLGNALQGTKSPKEINALIENINAQTAGLDEKMSGLPADHQLRNMAEELKVAGYMEALKWRRGDYL